MAALYDSITALNEFGSISFNNSDAFPPAAQGTNASDITTYLANEGVNPVYESTLGPFSGEGSWRFKTVGGSYNTRMRNYIGVSQNNALHQLIMTNNYTVGFWIKIRSLSGATAIGIHRGENTASGTAASRYSIGVSYRPEGGIVGNPNTYGFLYNNTQNGSTIIERDENNNLIEADKWYFIALQVATSGTTRTIDFYINGANKIHYDLYNFTDPQYINTVNWGFTSGGAASVDFNIANWFIGTGANIGYSQIQSVWNAATPATNITITETPATASALIVDPSVSVNSNAILLETPATASTIFAEPTIIVTTPDYTQITTSIVASVLFPDAIVQTNTFVNNVVSPFLASADIINNVDVQTGSDVSFGAQEMTASAEMTQPFLPVVLTASALMVNPIVSVPESYFNLVKANNPLIYFNEFPTGNAVVYPNYGSLNIGPIDKGAIGLADALLNQQPSGLPLEVVADGYSLGLSSTTISSNQNRFRYLDETYWASTLSTMYATKNWTHEFWYKPINNSSTDPTQNSSYTYSDGYADIVFTHTANTNTMTINLTTIGSTNISLAITNSSSLLSTGNWHNVAVVASTWSSTEIRFDVYVDSVLLGVATRVFDHTYSTIHAQMNQSSNALSWTLGIGNLAGVLLDEIAIYPSALSSATISSKYNFIDNIAPSRIIVVAPFTASANMINSNVIIVTNINNQETPATASSLFVDPAISPGKTINAAVDPMLASATNTDATVYWGWTVVATPMISAAESKEGFMLNDIYYNYVQANIAPYRYVTFDAADTSLDYGTDNDYSVVPTVVGGTIVNPDLGINGKSAKTAGTSYITDGVILKESEWNDSWGTGQNSYHSAFWFQRALDDASTTGLRVLWNLNGYKDNQHVVLYQYQGKLHMQFNNGSGTWIEQDTTNGLDLFDYNRHFVVIEFDHTNVNNNTVRLYVDAVLKMTVNLGSYTGSTTNAATADSGANDELNNHPRLSIGCLITPFASTALPVVPTNTKLIIDEVYWDKNSISSTQITNLFNTMPGKFNVNKLSDPMLASDEFVMPAFATTVNFVTDPFTASASFVEPELYIEREVIYLADPATATGLMANAEVNENRTVAADVMLAIATFNDAGVKITVPGGPMLAKISLPSSGMTLNVDGSVIYINMSLSPWVSYLRATESNKILPMREVM